VSVEVLSDVPGRFAVGSTLTLVESDGRRRPVRVESLRPHRGCLLVRFEGYSDRDRVESWRGAVLEGRRSDAPKPPEGSFYFHQLIGCTCRDRDAGALGEVVSVVEDGGGLLLEIEEEQRTLLVPFVAEYIEQIDPESRRIDLRLPPGLIEICASRS
jgi:16S rRNA processing protein RimM